MGRENKKEAVAALHRERIMTAAERLFSEKGYEQTTVEDISAASEYSRRTVYAYFGSKDDILHHIVEKGLTELRNDIEAALSTEGDFVSVFRDVFAAMSRYQSEYAYSSGRVNAANAAELCAGSGSETVRRILSLGSDINAMLAGLIKDGRESGTVRRDVIPELSVYILWSGVTSFLTLVRTKGRFMEERFSLSEEELMDYGFTQIMNSVLSESI